MLAKKMPSAMTSVIIDRCNPKRRCSAKRSTYEGRRKCARVGIAFKNALVELLAS